MHALLRHLEDVEFDVSPRVLGVDDHGREVLTYCEGGRPISFSLEALACWSPLRPSPGQLSAVVDTAYRRGVVAWLD